MNQLLDPEARARKIEHTKRNPYSNVASARPDSFKYSPLRDRSKLYTKSSSDHILPAFERL